ncbi:MAG TPA: hypothetical protein VKV16_08365 [Solirubrobacteraceae bacterium]|nr:hypothetical protein [Solirubrobacteraceae bacterium]
MYQPKLLRDRPRPEQIVLGGVIPAIAGGIAGVLVGISAGAYWGYAVFVAIGSVVAGFEHEDGWGGADRGLVAGVIYGAALLIVHAIVGTHAKVSLGGFPPLLAVITAIAGMLLSALGGRIARAQRERVQAQEAVTLD